MLLFDSSSPRYPGAVWLIETRRAGDRRRSLLPPPTSTRTVLAGQVLRAPVAIALGPGSLIRARSLLAFGVAWGDPLGTSGG
jgi:ABC-2 type transport system permease protein